MIDAVRVLLVLEPVIFRDDPDAVVAHFPWVELFRRMSAARNWVFAIAGNHQTCQRLENSAEADVNVQMFAIDSFEVISCFHFQKPLYSTNCYVNNLQSNNFLINRIIEIGESFRPDIVVTTGQNAIISEAFSRLRIFHVEQSPLPRLGHSMRTALDPCGHQVGALIEKHREAIRRTSLPSNVYRNARETLSNVLASRITLDARSGAALDSLAQLADGKKIAIFAMQPTDSVTYEGAYAPVELHNLIYRWAESLPEGWIGVPTYHFGQPLSEELEAAVAHATPRVRFLPRSYATGLTEALVTAADGLVTVSSTSAMSALLFGKQVVATGRSPLSYWCTADPAKINRAEPLNDGVATNLFTVLSHRFSHIHNDLMVDPGAIGEYFIKHQAGRIDDWYLDCSEWSLEHALSLFAPY